MGRKSGKGAGGQKRAAKVRARRQRIAQDEARREQHAKLVVERSGDPAFVRRVRRPDGSTTVSWSPETATGGEIQAGFEAQVDAFRRTLGRGPGPEDPVFFDPDADEPTMNHYTFSAAEIQAWEEAVLANAEDEFEDEFDDEFDDLGTDDPDVDDFVDLMELILRDAVRRTIEDHASAPAREVARLIASGDAAADDELDEPGYTFALSTAFGVLAGWLTGVRERDPDTPMAEEVIAWVRAEVGDHAADSAARASGLLRACRTGPEGGLTVQGLADELDDDFLPALMWLSAGAVARFGGGDVDWLPAIHTDSAEDTDS